MDIPLISDPRCECHGHVIMDGVDFKSAVMLHKYGPDLAAIRSALYDMDEARVEYFRDGGDALGVSGAARPIAREEFGIDYVTPVFAIDNNFNPVPGNLRDLLSLNITGLITVAASLLPDDVRIPVVSYFHKDPRFDAVSIDADQDSRLIMEHLKARGHRKIGFLGTFRLPRYESLVRTAEEYGLEFPERWHVNLDDLASPADSFDLLLERNKGRDLPSALILFNDDFAIPIMRRIHERGYRIPQDFSVIGHDDIGFSANTVPALTTIRFGSPDEIASAMIRLLMKRIEDPTRPREVTILKSVLIERESVSNKV